MQLKNKEQSGSNTLKQTEFEELKSDQKESSWFSDAIVHLGLDENGGWPDRFGDKLRNLVRTNQKDPIRILSLFSGAGGLDIGFHDAGFDVIECNELEEDFSKTLLANSKPGHRLEGTSVACGDIAEYKPSLGAIDFVIGGPPCQTFSAAGARAAGVNGTDDKRGNLFLEYARILESLKPKGFLFENVYRIVGAQKGKPWKQIQQTFSALGYKLFWRILDAADYGAPQFRERLFIVGLIEGEYQFPLPTHGPDSPDQRPYYNAFNAVCGLPTIKSKQMGGRHGHLLEEIPPGLNYSFFTERMGHPEPKFTWRSKFSDYLYKADPDRPVRTIKAQGGQYTGPFSWENRPFTIEELKRLQTFPDSYDIIGKRGRAIHQLGNSVPPQLARILALSIQDQIFGCQLPYKISTMSPTFELGFRRRKSALTNVYSQKAEEAIKLRSAAAYTEWPKRGLHNASNISKYSINFLEVSKDNNYLCSFSRVKDTLKVKISESKNLQHAFRLTLSMDPSVAQSLPFHEVQFQSSSLGIESTMVSWKYFEFLLTKYSHKDDLIQLLGYYQYKRLFSIKSEVDPRLKKADANWVIWEHVSQGVGVGQIVEDYILTELYDLPWEVVSNSLRHLKRVGFEIRSSKTNKQIPKGSYLIPYPFPTLNSRSLQGLTEL